VKEESFLRQAFAIGAFALLLSGSCALARADQTTAAPPSATQVISSAPLISTQAPSPDVAEWTAHLIATHRAAAPAHAGVNSAIGRFARSVMARTSKIAFQLTHNALRFLGTPYVFGGTTRYGFDCSGYTQHVFALLGVSIPRTADAQYYAGKRAVGGPRTGDLVFFQTYEPGPSHVGIYLGNGRFVHASSHGVMVSHLSDSYWSSRYLGAKRLLASR
jgi:cell wall-associated NlpC family hydrolase